uniref:Uncharacterized protein n=1 Tax=Panagrolaimus sp. PS1159 TaxID=55785 RepID=A0AC35GLW7_9BILA
MIVKAPKESECKSSLPKKRKVPTETVKDDEIIIKPPNFETINYNQDGSEKKRLFIFDEKDNTKFVNFNGNGASKPRLLIFLENDKTKCYEYFWDKRQQCFRCLGCVVMKKNLTAKVFKENEKEYVKLKNSDH